MLDNNKILELMSSFLEKAHRKLADIEIYKNKLSYADFKSTKKLLGIKFYNTNNFASKSSRLLLDYVLIEANMTIINKPFNLLYNQNTKRYEPCLVILVASLEIEGKVYPIDFNFWISQHMIEPEQGEEYLTKSQIAETMIERLVKKFNITEIIFDAGFCVPSLLLKINSLNIKYICRFPKSRNITHNDKKANASKIFKDSLNQDFYYYHNNGYLKSTIGQYADHNIQMVVVANTKEKLILKDLYCLITNNINLKYPTVLKTYKKRGKIEDLFKKLKTYLGLTVCNRHNEEYFTDRFNLAITAFIIIQDYSQKSKMTFHKALSHIKNKNFIDIKNIVSNSMQKIFIHQHI